MRELLRRFLLVLLGLLMGLALVEVISRMIYTRPWHEQLVIEQVRPGWGAGVWRNSLGLRDRDYAPRKPQGCQRVLILGDSFTYGQGVADNGAVFPELIERQLNVDAGPGGGCVEVLNGGIVASLSDHWVELYRQVRETFQPDIVLVVFFVRCGTRTTVMGTFFNPIRKEIVQRNRHSRLYRHSYAFRLYRDEQDRRLISTRYARAVLDSYFGDEAQTEEWRLAQMNLARIRDLARESHAAVGLVVYPALVELNDRHPFKGIQAAIVRYGHAAGIPTLDLLPAFLGRSGPDLWVSAADQHPNAAAHRITAEAVLPFVRELLAQRQRAH